MLFMTVRSARWMLNAEHLIVQYCKCRQTLLLSELRSETFRNGIFMQNAGVHEFLKQSHACPSARTWTTSR